MVQMKWGDRIYLEARPKAEAAESVVTSERRPASGRGPTAECVQTAGVNQFTGQLVPDDLLSHAANLDQHVEIHATRWRRRDRLFPIPRRRWRAVYRH
jgi:hypothetical protein